MDYRRVSLSKSAPELFQAALKLERLANEYALSAGIREGFAHLLRLRASQLNQYNRDRRNAGAG